MNKNDLKTAIGYSIRTRRHELQMTLVDVSDASGVTVSQISDIEHGRTLPSLVTLDAICKALQMCFCVGQTVYAVYHNEDKDVGS